jgi:hypothetical protein
MKRTIVMIPVLLCCLAVNAQQKHAIVFNSYNSVGFVAGRSPLDFTAQTENGIKFKQWFIGAGLGIDNYYRKTLPLFGAIKKEFNIRSNRLFLYGNIGGNFIAGDKELRKAFSTIAAKGGLYLDAGVGYKIKIGKRTGLFFSLGNTIKKISETETSTDTGFPYYYQSENKLRMISFKIGFQF